MTDLIPPSAIEKHIAFLGATGSGKTSAAKRGLVEPALDAGRTKLAGWPYRLQTIQPRRISAASERARAY